MKKLLWLALLVSNSLLAQKSPPGTEIILADISYDSGKVNVTNEINITNSKGYDSQPVFMDEAIYFTKFINDQTDIYKYDLASKTISPYLISKESEYSATQRPGKKGISVVRVELDTVQHLYWLNYGKGLFNRSKSKERMMSKMKQVGYHNWTGRKKLWMYVINDQQGDLYFQKVGKKQSELVASNIGRSLKSDLDNKTLYYIDNNKANGWITKVTEKSFEKTSVIELPQGVIDFERDVNGNFWCGKDNTLMYSRNGKAWQKVKEFKIPNLSHITRIAVSENTDKIAITFDEK